MTSPEQQHISKLLLTAIGSRAGVRSFLHMVHAESCKKGCESDGLAEIILSLLESHMSAATQSRCQQSMEALQESIFFDTTSSEETFRRIGVLQDLERYLNEIAGNIFMAVLFREDGNEANNIEAVQALLGAQMGLFNSELER